MKNSIKVLVVLLFVVVFVCGLRFWADNSTIVNEYYSVYSRNTELELAFVFTTALRINHPEAYDMIDPSLTSRLDHWMSTHQSNRCKHPADVFLIEIGTNKGSGTVFGCYGSSGWISFEVDDIVIKDMKVIDWGKVTENRD